MRSLTLRITAILTIGLSIPYLRGSAMLDPLTFLSIACLPTVLVGPILTDQQRPRAAILEACTVVALMLLVSLIYLNVTRRAGPLLFPPVSLLLDAATLSLTVTTAAAAFTWWLLHRLPPNTARWIGRIVILSALMAGIAIPAEWSFAIEADIPLGITGLALSLAACFALIATALFRATSGAKLKIP